MRILFNRTGRENASYRVIALDVVDTLKNNFRAKYSRNSIQIGDESKSREITDTSTEI